ncbi:MAG TPA: AraC family transcriptional regulator [Burkholderiaceae bacterium]|jgi:AraC-like DNA-binding protein|nr:AraC family transcriptional regulator [Burkholderiaceae bacterium]
MDALSGVLRSVRLEGAIYLNAEFTAPWCIRGRYGLARIRARLPAAEHVVFFHCLSEGSCKVRLADGGEVLDVAAGDVVLFPWDDRHLMGSDLQLTPMDTDTPLADEPAGDPEFIQMRHGGGGAATRFVCGYLGCSRGVVRPLLEALPRLLRIPIGEGQARALLHDLLQVGVRESVAARPGGDSMLAKLAELMFVEALRRYVESLPPEGKGWLAGLRDAHIGRALALLHEDPSKTWTVDELAREVALSRSALAERFATLVGEPPMQYLMRWRLALAARTLRSGPEAIVRVAERAGYESEAAFSRAFKREFGMPPAAWRRAVPA